MTGRKFFFLLPPPSSGKVPKGGGSLSWDVCGGFRIDKRCVIHNDIYHEQTYNPPFRVFPVRDRAFREFAKVREKLSARREMSSRIRELPSDPVCFAKTSKACACDSRSSWCCFWATGTRTHGDSRSAGPTGDAAWWGRSSVVRIGQARPHDSYESHEAHEESPKSQSQRHFQAMLMRIFTF